MSTEHSATIAHDSASMSLHLSHLAINAAVIRYLNERSIHYLFDLMHSLLISVEDFMEDSFAQRTRISLSGAPYENAFKAEYMATGVDFSSCSWIESLLANDTLGIGQSF